MLGDDDLAKLAKRAAMPSLFNPRKCCKWMPSGRNSRKRAGQGNADPVSSQNVSGWNWQIERF